MKTIVVINERHTLIPEQVKLLDLQFGSGKWKTVEIEDQQWSLVYYDQLIRYIAYMNPSNVVFISPNGYMVAKMTHESCSLGYRIWVMHSNDRVEIAFKDRVKYVPDRNSYRLLAIGK